MPEAGMQALMNWLSPLLMVEVQRELLLVLPLLALAAVLARFMRRRQLAGQRALPGEGLRRLAFPLLTALLLAIARAVTHQLGWSGQVLGIAVQMALAMAGVRMVIFALRHSFSQSALLASFERTAATLIWLVVALDILGVLPDVIAWLDSISLSIGKSPLTLWQFLQGVVTVIATVVLAMWLGGVIDARLEATEGMDSSLRVVLARLVKAVLLLLAVLMGMSLAGLDITTLSVFGGALGVGLGLGMQKIASNYVAGFIILLDRSIRIGSIIQVGAEQRGEVQQITTRYTVLKAPGGAHFLIPNENLVSSVVQNDTYSGEPVRLAVRVQVSYDSDVEQALTILAAIPVPMERVLTEPAPQSFLVSFDESGMTLELAFWIADLANGRLGLQSDVNREILVRFRAAGISIPFPQRELRLLGPVPPSAA